MLPTLWRNKYFRIFIYLSLALHIIASFFLFNTSFKTSHIPTRSTFYDAISIAPAERQKRIEQRKELFKKLQEIKEEKQRANPQENDNRPAQLRAKKSHFGWVFFDDAPPKDKNTPTQIPTTKEGTIAQAKTSHATDLQPTIKQTRPQKTHPHKKEKKQPEEQAPLPQPNPTLPANNTCQEKTQEPAEPPQAPQTPEPENIGLSEEKITPQPLKEPEKIVATEKPLVLSATSFLQPQPIAPTLRAQNQEQEVTRKTERRLKRRLKAHHESPHFTSLIEELKASANDKQPDQYELVEEQGDDSPEEEVSFDFSQAQAGPITTTKAHGAKSLVDKPHQEIIALTKGYLDSFDGGGDDLINQDGDPNKSPTLKDLEYASYKRDIAWELQSSWKQNFYHAGTSDLKSRLAIFEFTLDEKGYVTHSELITSSGNKTVDMMVMKNLDLASPFPPIPKHFNTKLYTVRLRVVITHTL